jgi:putative ABC transport system permease protein
MRARSRLERLLRSRILGPSVDRQIDEELDLHVEMVARELMAAGMEESKARAAAAERFRGRAAVAAACGRIARGAERRLRLAVQFEELRQDVAYGMRQLARSPGFTAVALLTLAAGLGAATAIFSVVEGVVLRRFAFAHPERLVFVREQWQGEDGAVSVGNFVDLRAASRSFTALTTMQFTRLNLAGDDPPERLLAARATSGMFAVFGVPPILGRPFDAGEDQPGHQRVVMLSYGLWMRRFAAEPSVLGRSLRLSGEPYQVVGVMPPGFGQSGSHRGAGRESGSLLKLAALEILACDF